MIDLSLKRVQLGLVHRDPWVRAATTLAVALAVCLPVGAIIGLLGALYGGAALVALAVAYFVLRNLINGLMALIGVICLLPFAAVPIDIGFSPTFLDLVLLALFFVWAGQIASHQEAEFIAAGPFIPVVAFLVLAVASFILGLSHAGLTANVLRHFGEILMSVSVFALVLNAVRTREQLRAIVTVLILAGFVAALVGIVLYFLPDTLTIRLLSLLRVVRYPSGSSVLRYIEDDPQQALRATSTSVDPNILGGMLIFVSTITAAQVVAVKPLLPRKGLMAMLVTMVVCLVLSFSRGSFAGFAAAIFTMGVLRYRKILWFALAAIVLLLVLPQTQEYVQHFVEGLQGQDLATQMRFGEYKDALILIARYPWFGVGFSGTPDIDTYLGVSNVYLLIAEQMGVIGLMAFLAALAAYMIGFLRTLYRYRPSAELVPYILGCSLAVAGAMVGGMLDHYLFNLDFPHAAALLWLVIGLGTVSMRFAKLEHDAEPASPLVSLAH
ncbi:MAG: O-antigen ligase family protein [Anaerolineae bacterium]